MIKALINKFIVYSGLLRLWIYKNRNAVNILMLHGVMDKSVDDSWEPFWSRISPDFLDRQLKSLSRYYQFITLDEAIDILSGHKPAIPNAIVLTFDDGYRNNLQYAMPILRKYNAPATIYLATEYVSMQTPFQIDRLDYALQTVELKDRAFRINDYLIEYDNTSRTSLAESYEKHRMAIQSVSENEQDYQNNMDAAALELETESGNSIYKNFQQNDWVNVLTWDEIREYKFNDVQFECHTRHHYKLALLEPDQIREELSTSKSEIEEKLERECKHFCYPVGSYNQTVVDEVRRIGCISAVITEVGLNHVGCDLLRLHRMPFPNGGDASSNIIFLSGLGYYMISVIRRLKGMAGIHV